MTTYCTVCRGEIPEKRANRGSHFCSEACHERYRRERRNLKAGKACRLCGRSPARLKRKTCKQEAVPMEHNAINEVN
jgi:hypothetical protein